MTVYTGLCGICGCNSHLCVRYGLYKKYIKIKVEDLKPRVNKGILLWGGIPVENNGDRNPKYGWKVYRGENEETL